MRQQLRLLSVVLPFTVSSLVAAARRPEVEARERVEAEGMTQILLVRTAGGFEWSGERVDGARCDGTVLGQDGSRLKVTSRCAP